MRHHCAGSGHTGPLRLRRDARRHAASRGGSASTREHTDLQAVLARNRTEPEDAVSRLLYAARSLASSGGRIDVDRPASQAAPTRRVVGKGGCGPASAPYFGRCGWRCGGCLAAPRVVAAATGRATAPPMEDISHVGPSAPPGRAPAPARRHRRRVVAGAAGLVQLASGGGRVDVRRVTLRGAR